MIRKSSLKLKNYYGVFYTDSGRIKDEDTFTKKTDFDVSKNFYLAHDGIHFIYHVYEIAPYSEGEQDLVIPWVWLQIENLLTSDFVKQKYYDLRKNSTSKRVIKVRSIMAAFFIGLFSPSI